MKKLRTFLCIDKKILDDYIAAMENGLYEEEIRETNEQKRKNFSGKLSVLKIGSGEGGVENGSLEKAERKVHDNSAAKFDRLYHYLSDDEEEPLQYYDALTEQEFGNIGRDCFIEVLATPRFSKMQNFLEVARKVSPMARALESYSGQELLDPEAKKGIEAVMLLDGVGNQNEISCVFSFDDGAFPLVAKLKKDCFECDISQFTGQVSMLCKVQKKIKRGSSIRLDEIFDYLKKFSLDDNQWRVMEKIENPDIIRDEIEGPALQVVPIAIYL